MELKNLNELGSGVKYKFILKPPQSSTLSLLPETLVLSVITTSEEKVRVRREDNSTFLIVADQIQYIHLF